MLIADQVHLSEASTTSARVLRKSPHWLCFQRMRSNLIAEAGWATAVTRRHGGKSGLHRAGCQVTPGGREPTESAAENTPPKRSGAGKGEMVR